MPDAVDMLLFAAMVFFAWLGWLLQRNAVRLAPFGARWSWPKKKKLRDCELEVKGQIELLGFTLFFTMLADIVFFAIGLLRHH